MLMTILSLVSNEDTSNKTNTMIICFVIGALCLVGFVATIFWFRSLYKSRRKLKNSFSAFGTHKVYYNLLMLWLSSVIGFGFFIAALILLGIGIGSI